MSISDKCSKGKEKQDKEILAVWCLNRLTRENFSEAVIFESALSEVREQTMRISVREYQCPRQRKQMQRLWEVSVPAEEQKKASRAGLKGVKETVIGNEAAEVARCQLVGTSQTKVRISGFKCWLLL